MEITKQYKFLRKGMISKNGDHKWRFNKWYKVDGKLELCQNGFHSSIEPYDAFSYVQGEILAIVECRGKHLKDKDKYCWEEQRVIKTYKWTKKESLKLAIFSAEICLKNFEKWNKTDKSPREAIEAAKRVLFKDTSKNRSAAWSARSAAGLAAWSAGSSGSVESAAWSAARSAESAAGSAGLAAWSAAWSAGSAAESAGLAAVKKIQRYFKQIVEEKENE